MQPDQTPIGLFLAHAAKSVRTAFGDALAEAGGSLPVWVILLSLIQDDHRTQAELAASIGIQGPTLTHHLNAMEQDKLLTRTRHPDNRRIHQVTLTAKGRKRFSKLREVAVAFDRRLRAGFSQEELNLLRTLLHRLAANVDPSLSDSRNDPKKTFPNCGLQERS